METIFPNTDPRPTKESAAHFALILSAGTPPREAIQFMCPEELSPGEVPRLLDKWMRSKVVQDAILAQQGAPWQTRSLEEKIKFSIDKHYTEMAWFLYAHNYADLQGPEKLKADTCRQVLEAKLAGMAGKMDALSRFYDAVLSGKVTGVGGGGKVPAPSTPEMASLMVRGV